MVDFIIGISTFAIIIGIGYLIIRLASIMIRSAIMLWKMDNSEIRVKQNKIKVMKDFESYQKDINAYYEKTSGLSTPQFMKLEAAMDINNKEIREQLALAQLQLQEWRKAYETWKDSDPTEGSDLSLIKTFEKDVDVTMLRKYVADEMRIVADIAPISGNHIAQARILLAADQYERGESEL